MSDGTNGKSTRENRRKDNRKTKDGLTGQVSEVTVEKGCGHHRNRRRKWMSSLAKWRLNNERQK